MRNRNSLGLLCVLFLCSCSPRDFLTRRLATDLLAGSEAFKVQQQFVLRTGIVSSKDYPSPQYVVLQHHGWISATAAPCSPGIAPLPCWNILLTPSGVETIRSLLPLDQADRSSLSIPVAKKQLVAVTGIAKQDNSADVEFTWRWIALNELGEALYSGDLLYRSTVGFRKYDDGWRVLENSPHPVQYLDDAIKNAEPIS